MLSLKVGDRIAILSKAGNQKGWWKGQVGENVIIIFVLLAEVFVVAIYLLKEIAILFQS